MLDTRGIGILQSVERLLGDIYIPALSKSSNWGDISDKQASTVRQGFMNQLENFIGKKFKAIVKASYFLFHKQRGKCERHATFRAECIQHRVYTVNGQSQFFFSLIHRLALLSTPAKIVTYSTFLRKNNNNNDKDKNRN